MKSVAAFLFATAVLATPAGAADTLAEHWSPVARLIGTWSGTASGSAGEGVVQRRYALVMNGRYLQETNTSTYPPQEKNKQGEVHEHLGMISFDRQRKSLVMRQFHVEGFVNTFRFADTSGPNLGTVVFNSEAFENFNNAWKARETYDFVSDDEFVETFELAPPGQPYKTYSRTQFKRVSR